MNVDMITDDLIFTSISEQVLLNKFGAHIIQSIDALQTNTKAATNIIFLYYSLIRFWQIIKDNEYHPCDDAATADLQ